MSSDWVLTDTLLAIENDVLVGVICLRYDLNDFLKDFGHVGYSVRPSKRGNGLATSMLREVLLIAENHGLDCIQLSAFEENIASCRIIEKCGGIFIRSYDYLGNPVKIYKIVL